MAQAKGAQPGLLCGYCGRSFARRELTPAEVVRPQLAQHLDQSRPDWRRTGFICRDDLTNARQAYVEEMIVKDRGEVTELDKSVIESISRHETLSSDFYSDYEDNLSFGERLSDRVSEFGGSWPFIITFGGRARRLDGLQFFHAVYRREISTLILTSSSISSCLVSRRCKRR